MKLITKLAILAVLAFTLVPHAAYAAKHNNDNGSQSEDSGNDDDDSGRQKPKFQTKFFGD